MTDRLTDDFCATCYANDWQFAWAGFCFQQSRWGFRNELDWIFPYWSLVLPLTLLSAWLILGKRRKAKPPISTRDESSK